MIFILATLSYLYAILIFLLALAPFWPYNLWWVVNCFEVLPVWVLLIPAVFLLLVSLSVRRKRFVITNALSVGFVFLFIMSFNLPASFQGLRLNPDTFHVRVLTANVEGKEDLTQLLEFIEKTSPDVMAFQETSSGSQQFLQNNLERRGWRVEFKEQLGIATKYKILESDYKNRRMFGGWGAVVAYFTLETPKGEFTFFTVHLETPRKGIEPLMYQKLAGIPDMKNVTQLQESESLLASKWANDFSAVLIAGDFNMLTTNPIFQRYWGKYQDAFSNKGIGFGYSKFTRWHAVRIDHILADRYWHVRDVMSGPDIGGDHRPVVADLELITNFLEKREPKKKDNGPVDFSKVLIYENFEDSTGDFLSTPGAFTQITRKDKERSSVLHIVGRPMASEAAVGTPFVNWPLDRFPHIKFLYKLPAGTSVGLRVETEFGDWVCIGGSSIYQCPVRQVQSAVGLKDDGTWHEADINIKEMIHALLPGIKNLKTFQFFIPSDRHDGDQFWIDDFAIADSSTPTPATNSP